MTKKAMELKRALRQALAKLRKYDETGYVFYIDEAEDIIEESLQ